MNILNLNQLYTFYIVAREGSIKAGSKILNITQPALSTQIKKLEETLGFSLFRRKPRQLLLTENGQDAFNLCKQIFGLVNSVSYLHMGESQSNTSQLNVGYLSSLSKDVVSDVVVSLWGRASKLNIVQNDHDLLLKDLDDGKLDIVITHTQPRRWAQKWQIIRVLSRKMLIVAHPALRALRQGFPSSLNNQPILMFSSRNPMRNGVLEIFNAQSVKPMIVGECDDFSIILRLCMTKKVVGVLSEHAAADALKAGKIVKLGELSGLGSDVWLIYDSGIQKSIKGLRTSLR